MSKLVKKRTHRYCHRCGTEVLYERYLDYPYYCPTCDENMFHFETYRKWCTQELKLFPVMYDMADKQNVTTCGWASLTLSHSMFRPCAPIVQWWRRLVKVDHKQLLLHSRSWKNSKMRDITMLSMMEDWWNFNDDGRTFVCPSSKFLLQNLDGINLIINFAIWLRRKRQKKKRNQVERT